MKVEEKFNKQLLDMHSTNNPGTVACAVLLLKMSNTSLIVYTFLFDIIHVMDRMLS